MKKMIVLVTMITGLLCGMNAYAADPSNAKVAVVNAAQILHSSKQVQDATSSIRKQFEPQKQAIDKMQAGLQKDVDNLKKNASVMKQSDQDALQKKIADERQALIGKISEFQKSLNKAQTDEMKKVFDKFNTVVEKIAKQDGYTVVIDSQFVLYSTDTNDITDQVEKAFNKS